MPRWKYKIEVESDKQLNVNFFDEVSNNVFSSKKDAEINAEIVLSSIVRYLVETFKAKGFVLKELSKNDPYFVKYLYANSDGWHLNYINLNIKTLNNKK